MVGILVCLKSICTDDIEIYLHMQSLTVFQPPHAINTRVPDFQVEFVMRGIDSYHKKLYLDVSHVIASIYSINGNLLGSSFYFLHLCFL